MLGAIRKNFLSQSKARTSQTKTNVAFTHTQADTITHARTPHTLLLVYTHTHTHTPTHTHSHPLTHAYSYSITHILSYTHTNKHTFTHAHLHTQSHILSLKTHTHTVWY